MNEENDLISILASKKTNKNIYDHTLEKFIEDNKNYFGPKEILKLETEHWVLQYRYIVLKALIKNVLKRPGSKVLDLGLGSGLISNELSKLSSYYKGIDKDVDCVKFAIENFNLNAHLINMPKEDINKEGFKYDYVFALNFLEYFDDIDRILFKIYETLTDNGYLVLSVPSNKYDYDEIDIKNNDKIKHKFKYEEIKRYLNNNKFKINYYTFYQDYSNITIANFLNKESLSKKASKIKADDFFSSLKETIGEALIEKDLVSSKLYTEDIEDLTIIRSNNSDLLRASLYDLEKIKKNKQLKTGKQIFIIASKMTNDEFKDYNRKKDQKSIIEKIAENQIKEIIDWTKSE